MPTLKKGFYHPISILILALITLTVALAIFANSGFFANKNLPTPSQPSPKPPPKTSPLDQTVKTYQDGKHSFQYPGDLKLATIKASIPSDDYLEIRDKQDIKIIDVYYNLVMGREQPCTPNICRREILSNDGVITIWTNASTASGDVYNNDRKRHVHLELRVLTDENLKIFREVLSTFQFLN